MVEAVSPSRARAHKLWKILSAPHSAGSLAFVAFVLGVIVNRATGVDDQARVGLLSLDTIGSMKTGKLVPCTAEFLDFAKSSKMIWMEHGVVLGSVLCTLISIAVAVFARGWHAKGAFAATSTVVMLETVTFYLLVHTGNTSVLCVADGERHVRAEMPLRYIWWACTTVQFESAMYKMVGGVPANERGLALLAAILGIAAGYGAAVTPVNSAQSLTLLVTAFAVTGYMLVVRCRILLKLSKWPVEKSALKRATLLAIPLTTMLAMGMIPAVWVAAYVQVAHVELTMVLYCLPEVLSKCAMCNLLSWSDLPQHMDTLRLQLLEAEALRVGSQAKETAMRSIMRYLFHELRVPLNSIVLGLNDTSEALEDMLGVLEGEGVLLVSPRVAGGAMLAAVKVASLLGTTQESTATGTKGSTTGIVPSPHSCAPALQDFTSASSGGGGAAGPSSYAHAATGNPSSAGESEGTHLPHAVTSTAAYGGSDRSASAESSSSLRGPVPRPATAAPAAAAAAAAAAGSGGAMGVRLLQRVHSARMLLAGSRGAAGGGSASFLHHAAPTAAVGGTGLDAARLWSLGSTAHQPLSPSSMNGGGADESMRDPATPSFPASPTPMSDGSTGGVRGGGYGTALSFLAKANRVGRTSSNQGTAGSALPASEVDSSKGVADPPSMSGHRHPQSPKVAFAVSAGGVKDGGGGGWKSRDASVSPGRSHEGDRCTSSSTNGGASVPAHMGSMHSTGAGTQDASSTAQHATVVSMGTQRALTANQAGKVGSSATLTWAGMTTVLHGQGIGAGAGWGGSRRDRGAGSGDNLLTMDAQHAAPLNCTNEALMVGLKDVTHILAMCKTSALGLGRLLDDFLSLDKIEQGQLQVELGTVQVKRMVDETLRLFQPAVESKQLQIKRVAHRRVPATIVGDDHKLCQCLANFVSNAIKFSPPGGKVTVHISVVYAPPKSQFEEVAGPAATPRGIAGAPGPKGSLASTPTSLSLKQAGERSRAGSSQLGGSRISVGSAGGGGSLLTLSRAAGGRGVPDREEPGAAPASHLSLPVHVQEQSALGPSKAPPSRGSYTAKRPPAVLTTPFPSVSGPAPVPAAVALDMDAAPVHTDSGDDTSSEDVAELPQLGGQDSSTGKSRDGLLTGLLARAASAWAASMRYVSTAVAPASTPGGVPGRGGTAPGFDLHGGSSISPVGSDAGSRLLGGATPPLAAGFAGAGRVRDAPARVYAEQQEGTVAYLKVSVEDQGVGISPADQAKLFQPFQQIRAGALQKGNGTGLGLSIVRQIINLSGGFVSVESAEGKGSTFSFCVPVAQPKPSLPIETGGPDVLSAGTSAPFSGRRMSSSRESNQKGGFSVTAAEIPPGPVPVRSVVPVGNATAPTARGGSTPHTATAVHVHDSSVVVPPVGPAHPYNLHPAHAGAGVVPHPPQPLSGLQEEDGHEASTGTEATEESGSWLYTAAPTSRSTSRTLARTLVSHRSATGRVSTSEVDISSPVPAAAQGGSASKLIHEVTGLVETSGTSAVSTARSPALGPVVVVPGVFRGVHIHVGQAPRAPHLHIHAVHAGVGSLQTIMSVGELPTTASQEGESRSTGTERTENGAAAAAGGAGAGGVQGAVPQEAEAGVQDSLHIGQEGRAPNLRKQSVTVVSLHDVLDAARGEAGVMDILGSARTPVQVSSCATPTPSLTTDQPSPLPSVPVAATEGSTGAGMGRLTGPPTPSTALGIKAVQVGRLTGWYSEPEQEARHHPQHGHPSGTISTAGTSVSGSAGQSTGPGSRERRRGSKERPLALDVPVARSPLARHSTGPATATPSAATRASSRGWAAGAGYSGAHSTMSVPGSVEEGTPAAGQVKLTRAVVVDDIASNRQLLVRMLKRRGVLECYEAADGTEVLAIADQLAAQGKLHTIQAWFLDEEMPVMNGSKAIAALRGAQYSVKAVILSATGNALAEDQTALVTAGANAVLPKPIQVDALEGLLLRHGGLRLGQRRGSVT